MVISMKKIFASFLALCIFSAVPAFAIEPTTVTTTQEEHYNASSPTGYFATYPAGSTVQTVNTGYYNGAYIPVNDTIITTGTPVATNIPATYETTQAMPATVQQIDSPQQYDRVVTTTQTVRDDRENADKILDRSMKTVGILGIAGLFAAGITAIFAAVF
ncbi:MAG: hypothetical protein K6A44_01430 [bacterium]|nr:hypothetical protein [bacterium]